MDTGPMPLPSPVPLAPGRGRAVSAPLCLALHRSPLLQVGEPCGRSLSRAPGTVHKLLALPVPSSRAHLAMAVLTPPRAILGWGLPGAGPGLG